MQNLFPLRAGQPLTFALPLIFFLALTGPPALAADAAPGASGVLVQPELPEPVESDALNLYCLRAAYPQVSGLVTDPEGQRWLELTNGRRVLYAGPKAGDVAPGSALSGPDSPAHSSPRVSTPSADPWDVDVRASLAEPYPLEPERPPTPPGESPGRRRSYALLAALYGSSAAEVRSGLRTETIVGRQVQLSTAAAQALHRAVGRLAQALSQQPGLTAWLRSSGGFMWRRIAGEKRLSPHSYGIALDLSPELASYWRWSKLRPHPQQQSYPQPIVAAFEAEGFIWGGKWHEYDIMHFEYRPELICKARLLRGQIWEAPEVPEAPARAE